MASIPNYKCWEIMNCNNFNCPAMLEPDTPCWEIAKKLEAFVNVSHTCQDCIVYILKEGDYVLSKTELHNIIIQKWLMSDFGPGPGRQSCF